MSQYVVSDYIETTDFGLYFVGDVTKERGGSVRWQDCSSWENWPNTRWSPGIGPAPLTVSASSTGTRRHPGNATAQITFGGSAEGERQLGGRATGTAAFSAVFQGNVKLGGEATGSMAFSASVLTAVIHPPFAHTTFSVPSETRAYLLPLDPDNRVFAIVDSETREYPVGFESRTRTIESETRNRPVEVY